MIDHPISFVLPQPWSGKSFSRDKFGVINFLVGPNGSGKSRFADSLRQTLPNARLLGTDRLQGMGANSGFGLFGDNLASGYQKAYFSHFKSAGTSYGSGVDTFILLEERPDLRVRVEATLSSLFNRRITIEWDSGNLIPKATSAVSGASYRLDRDECHGIRELLVLLTHLYNDAHPYLIIDEPELNLHPQYQSFFMQEVRKIAGNPEQGMNKKAVFLITHSPFIIDVRSIDDLKSIISFSSDHSDPISITDASERVAALIPRLNVYHKQLFFSDNPIFVEGILDAQIIEAIQERRKFSITSAGSCIIEVGGCEEVNKYVEFCRGLKKSAYFLYDLDSLFTGNLRQCIRADGEVSAFLAQLGLGGDFGRYCGELDKQLTDAISRVRESTASDDQVLELKRYLESLANADGKIADKNLLRARVAVATDLRSRRAAIAPVISDALANDIDGRIQRIVEILRSVNVFLLSGGALEHYLPAYQGDRYKLEDTAKRNAVDSETLSLAQGSYDANLAERYGELLDNIARLPAKPPVDTDAVLMGYLGDYIHEIQGLLVGNRDWGVDQLNAHFSAHSSGIGRLFQISNLSRQGDRQFSALVRVQGADGRVARISHETNAGMRGFELVEAQSVA